MTSYGIQFSKHIRNKRSSVPCSCLKQLSDFFPHNLDSKLLRNSEIYSCSSYHNPMVNHLHCEKLQTFNLNLSLKLKIPIVFVSKIKKSSLISSIILPGRYLRTLIKSPLSFPKKLHSKFLLLHRMSLLLRSPSNWRSILLVDNNLGAFKCFCQNCT